MSAATRLESRAAAPDTADAEAVVPPIRTMRLVAACALLVGLAFVQDPGFLVSDTKFDLATAPGEFLARAFHLWDAEGAFGQVQNQAYGYLWPMGPFFALGDLLGLPGWGVQRAWQALVLCVAFVGATRLARSLGVRSDAACLIAAAAYALSPRMLTTLGPISIEAWPSAVAPWVLLPLVVGSRTGSPRRAAAWSAVAVAMVGGVNAAASFAVVPLGAIWLLTRSPGARRRALMLWWPALTLLGTLWWLVPLVLLGSYSPPFLDYIETSAITTFPTTLVDVLRGTSNWVPYVDPGSRAGNELVTTGYLALNSGVVLLVGAVGLLDRDNPHRRFLGLGLTTGVLLVAAGHVGAVEGWFAADVRGLLDGVLSPLRNVHKFDPVVRLPMVMGLAWALGRVLERPPGAHARSRPRPEQVTFTAMTLLAVVGAALPALGGRLEPTPATLGVPDYWDQAAAWLDDESEGGVALLAPGSGFATYLWGSPRDEPMQWLADSRWAVRNVIPLAPPGNLRMLDAVEERLAQGRGSPGLTRFLQRAGVEHLVVRNDLAIGSDGVDPVVVHEAIAESPGLELAAEFGPDLGGEAHLETPGGRVVVNGGRQATYAAVEIFTVGGAAATTSSQATVVAGGPEDLVDLLDLGVVGDEPTVMASDVPDADLAELPVGRVVLTDGLRDRERNFARIHDGYGPTRDPGYVARSTNPTADYGIDDLRWRTTVRLRGVNAVSASSSTSDPTALGGARVGELPWAALDGDPATAWVSGRGASGAAWWRVDVGAPLPPTVTLTAGRNVVGVQGLRVVTAAGATERIDLGPGDRREVTLPEGGSTWLRVEDAAAVSGRTLSLAEVALDGVTPERSLVLPALPETWGAPDAIVVRRAGDARTGCVTVGVDVRCAADRAVPGEEQRDLRRVVPLTDDASYGARLTVVPRPGAALNAATLIDQPVAVTVSSRPVADARAGGVAAIDGDPGTTWLARADQEEPRLSLRWLGRQTLTGIRIATDPDTAAAAPTELAVRWPGGSADVTLRDGYATLPTVTTDRMRITVLAAESVNDVDFASQSHPVPVGITELEVDGLSYLPLGLSADPIELPCGSGPDVRIGAVEVSTAVTASPLGLARGLPAPARLCTDEPLTLAAGENDVVVEASAGFAPQALVLERVDAASAAAPGTGTGVEADGPTRRQVVVPDGDRVVALHENTNDGWTASLGDDDATPVVLDGWQQGFVVPDDGGGALEVSYAPDGVYRAGLLLGGLAALALLVVLWATRRRPGPDPSPLEPANGGWWVTAPAVLLLGGLTTGFAGVVVAVCAAALTLLAIRLLGEAAPLLLSLPVLIAFVPSLVQPWGGAAGWAGDLAWPQFAVLVALVSVLVAGTSRLRPRRPTSFSRSAGRSTSR